MPPPEHLGRWRSTGAERRFRELEDELWAARCPIDPEAVDVDTHLGRTRAYRWPGDGERVLLLHGLGGTSLQWAGYVEHLRDLDLTAVDTIGDVGRSRQVAPVQSPDDLAGWLDEVLAGVGVDAAHVVAASYGGFLALNLAARRPDRARSLTLLEPVGLMPFRLAAFMRWGGAVFASSLLPERPRRAAARRLRMPALEDRRVMRLALRAQRDHRARLLPARPLTDDELRAIPVAVLLLLGEQSPVHDAHEVGRRTEALVPSVEVEVVPDAGHALPLSHTELVVDRLHAFLA